MNTHELQMQVKTFTGVVPGIVGYTVVDCDESESAQIDINSIQSAATRFDMKPAVDGKEMFALKLAISNYEADKAFRSGAVAASPYASGSVEHEAFGDELMRLQTEANTKELS